MPETDNIPPFGTVTMPRLNKMAKPKPAPLNAMSSEMLLFHCTNWLVDSAEMQARIPSRKERLQLCSEMIRAVQAGIR